MDNEVKCTLVLVPKAKKNAKYILSSEEKQMQQKYIHLSSPNYRELIKYRSKYITYKIYASYRRFYTILKIAQLYTAFLCFQCQVVQLIAKPGKVIPSCRRQFLLVVSVPFIKFNNNNDFLLYTTDKQKSNIKVIKISRTYIQVALRRKQLMC